MATLTGQTILLTGATGVIGSAIARELTREGARIVLHYGRNRSAAQVLADEIGKGALCLQADLGDPQGAARLWSETEQAAGRIHALVNNAGILQASSVEGPLDDWQRAWTRDLQVNLLSAADLCRGAIRHFRARGGGRIVNMASRAAQGGYRADAMSYGASKAALINLTQSIARGFGHEGITAVALAPGWVRTKLSEAHVAENGPEAVLGDIPIGRMAEPQEIAELVAFVLRPSQHSISGAVLDVNGASRMR